MTICKCNAHNCNCYTSNPVEEGWTAYYPANRGGRIAYLCEYHAEQFESYGYESDTQRGKTTDGFTYGVEFEVNHACYELHAHFLQYGFTATSDCTVGTEYKSPIFKNGKWHKLLDTAETIIANSNYTEVGSNCGTHLHIGHIEHINETTNRYMARYYHILFDTLSAYMFDNAHKTQALFGRAIKRNSYYEPVHFDRRSAYEHSNFINLQHDNTIEFRACKFVTAKQYKLCIQCCKDMTACLITNFLLHYSNESKREHKAQITAKKLVRIFDKYATKALAL